MITCPECKSNVNDNLQHCPICGAPLPPKKNKKVANNGDPKLSRAMVIFIIVGTVLVILIGVLSFTNFNSQQEKYIAVDPDTTLLGKEVPYYEDTPVDTTKTDSIDKAEREDAKKVYNSIRKQESEEETAGNEGTNEEKANSEVTTEQQPIEPITIAPAAKPKVESIEN